MSIEEIVNSIKKTIEDDCGLTIDKIADYSQLFISPTWGDSVFDDFEGFSLHADVLNKNFDRSKKFKSGIYFSTARKEYDLGSGQIECFGVYVSKTEFEVFYECEIDEYDSHNIVHYGLDYSRDVSYYRYQDLMGKKETIFDRNYYEFERGSQVDMMIKMFISLVRGCIEK